ncbi:MAG: hypothetical protein OIF32_12480, partial [Campylobacterales bacterium]|nr:hypothetical protein [Campylobacterales bacterium]
GVSTHASCEEPGAQTTISNTGAVVTGFTSTEGLEGKVDTNFDGTSGTYFKNGGVTQRTTSVSTPFEEGNRAQIKMVDGVMELHIRTKVTKVLEFE